MIVGKSQQPGSAAILAFTTKIALPEQASARSAAAGGADSLGRSSGRRMRRSLAIVEGPKIFEQERIGHGGLDETGVHPAKAVTTTACRLLDVLERHVLAPFAEPDVRPPEQGPGAGCGRRGGGGGIGAQCRMRAVATIISTWTTTEIDQSIRAAARSRA